MRTDKLTSRFQQALSDAQSLATGRDHNLIEPVHLLVALIDQAGGSTRPLLAHAEHLLCRALQNIGYEMQDVADTEIDRDMSVTSNAYAFWRRLRKQGRAERMLLLKGQRAAEELVPAQQWLDQSGWQAQIRMVGSPPRTRVVVVQRVDGG